MKVHPDERKKKHHAKSRNGCISCKKRHLKCDEKRPACTRCVKDFGHCDGYRAPKAWMFEPSMDDQPEPWEHRCSDSHYANSSSPTNSIPSLTHSSGSARSHQGSTSPEPEHTRQKRWAPKSRSGCATCKKRRIKCDEGRPACGRCTASNRVCEYITPPKEETEEPNLEALEVVQRKRDLFAGPDDPPAFLYVNSTPYKTQFEHQTLYHWLGRAESCSVISRNFGQFNIMGEELPRVAWNYESVKHGLLAAASVTASIEKFAHGGVDEKQAVVTALKHSQQAIQSLLKENPCSEITVLVAFVFWFMEAWIGSWDRAVMHLASAARMSEQALAKGQISKALAWYVNVCEEGVPQALRTQQILSFVQELDEDHDEKFHVRLQWGIREAEDGLALLDECRRLAHAARPKECDSILILLCTHQAQMRFMSTRWKMYEKTYLMRGTPDIPPPPETPMYSKVTEHVNYFISNDERFDPLIMAVRLKMIQRSLPLWVAGTNMEIRRDAAMSIPIKTESVLEPPELPLAKAGGCCKPVVAVAA